MDNFIKTSCEETRQKLKAAGLPEMGKEGKYYVFVNIGKNLSFTEDDKKKMILTNIVCL